VRLDEFVWLIAKESARLDVGHFMWHLRSNDSSIEQVCPHVA